MTQTQLKVKARRPRILMKQMMASKLWNYFVENSVVVLEDRYEFAKNLNAKWLQNKDTQDIPSVLQRQVGHVPIIT